MSLPAHPIRWHAEDLWLQVLPQLPGFTIEVLPSIDSSNTELMRRARAGQAEPALLIAETQTAGRGRQGRQWLNAPGDCLMYSLGLVLAPQDFSGLSLVVGLSLAESLQAAAAPGAPKVGVKWPNDLWLHDAAQGTGRKLAGTLIETANLPVGVEAAPVAGSGALARYVIVGTGINVRPPADTTGMHTPPACLQELQPQWQAPDALHAVLPALVRDVLAFAQHGFAPFVQRFAQVDVLRGQAVHLSDGTTGTAQGVAADGELLVHTAQGLRRVVSGDVSVRPQGMALPPVAPQGQSQG